MCERGLKEESFSSQLGGRSRDQEINTARPAMRPHIAQVRPFQADFGGNEDGD